MVKKFGIIFIIASLFVVCVVLVIWLQKPYVAVSSQQVTASQSGVCQDKSSLGIAISDTKLTDRPSVTPTPTAQTIRFHSDRFGVSFRYPQLYNSPEEHDNYVSVTSPININRGKGIEPENGELKVEIYFLPAKEGEILEQTVASYKRTSAGKILKEEQITVDGITGYRWSWQGVGTGKTIFLLHKNRKIIINSFPAETTRNEEYNQIISSIAFDE